MSADPDDNPGRFWFIYLAILGTILFIGWRQPLRYRFMSRSQIEAIENPPTPVPVATPSPSPEERRSIASPTPSWMFDPNRRSPLDRR